MPSLVSASPRCSVFLFKTIDRSTSDGQTPASQRYQGKDPYIDLTPFLGDNSSVRTSKSVREPSGGFSISFTDKAHKDIASRFFVDAGFQALESVYGLVEPMDVIEIRMWRGVGNLPLSEPYPIIMRGFVSDVTRGQAMGQDGKPMRIVTITGQDYGKIWQTYQVLYLPAYTDGKPLLTSFALSELFGVSAVNSMPAGEFVRQMIQKVINPHIQGFLASTLPLDIPKEIQTTDTSIFVKHGKVNISFDKSQTTIYQILQFHGDVGHWNELFIEDREDGVHCVYRPIPALRLVQSEKLEDRKIHDDAPDPEYCLISDGDIENITVSRTDSSVSNFYWVNNSRFDLVDDLTRRLHLLGEDNTNVNARDYPNSSAKFYGIRVMNAETQQGEDSIQNMTGGLPKNEHEARGKKMESWLERRVRQLKETNQDNVMLERGTARVKGGPMRGNGTECLRAGDYAVFEMGKTSFDAYVVQVDHEFIPFQGYTTTLTFERGEGFARRIEQEGGALSPYIVEQASL